MKSMPKFLILMLAVIVCAPAYAVETWPESDNGTSRFISGPNLKVKVWALKPTDQDINHEASFVMIKDGAGAVLARFNSDEISK